MAQEQFSALHPFTRAEVRQTVEAVAHEARSKRLLVHVTTGHRENARKCHVATRAVSIGSSFAILAAEITGPTVSRTWLAAWCITAIVSYVLRAALHNLVIRLPPATVSTSLAVRLIPISIVLVALMHWGWTLLLFVGADFTLTVLVIGVSLLALGTASLGFWLTTPISAVGFAGALWIGLSLRAWQTDLVPLPAILVVDAGLLALAWITIYFQSSLFQPLLDRSDQVDLLMAELKEANALLETMRNEMAATLEHRSTFFAGASHDFKQRLHAIKLMAFSTIVDLPRKHPGYAALSRMSAEVDELEQYFTHVLDFARIEARDMHADIRPVRLRSVFQRVNLAFEDLAAERKVDLKFKATELQVMADPAMLQRMVENLVSNAMKFTRRRVLVAARRRRSGEVVVEIWDQGPGIPNDALSRIFEAFYQADNTHLGAERGIGLGLALVKRFADRIGCKITVKSKAGRGSVFRLHFPASIPHTPST